MRNSDYLRHIKLFYWLIFFLLIIFGLLSFYVGNVIGPILKWDLKDVVSLKTIVVILSLAGIPAAYIYHNKRIMQLDDSLASKQKLKQYRNSFFVKIATFEALAIIALIGYMISADYSFLLIFALLFVAFLLNIPTKHKIISELNFNYEEGNNDNSS